MSKWIRGLVSCSLAAASVSAAGIACAGHSAADLTLLNAFAGFGANVFAGFSVDALKMLHQAFFASPATEADSHGFVLRTLRGAQLQALREVATRFDQSRASDFDRDRQADGDRFSALLRDYLAQETSRLKTLSAADFSAPSPSDAEKIRGEAAARVDADFGQSLAAQQGVGPVLDAFRLAAAKAVLAELRAYVHEDIPPAFVSLFLGGRDGADGWFAMFLRAAATQLRKDPEFARLWQAEQMAALQAIARDTGADVELLGRAFADQSAALAAYAAKLDEVASETRKSLTILKAIDARLDRTQPWLYFNAAFEPRGWLKFHAFNRAIPFQGREAEMSRLFGFLEHPAPFRWWIVTGPGGSGKTRLALELCLRAHLKGWRVGFLERNLDTTAFDLNLREPTLIIADYAAEHIKAVRAIAVRLAHSARAGEPASRLLLVERLADDGFWRRFLSSYGGEAGVLEAQRHEQAPIELPGLSEDDVWRLVQACPWREDGRFLAVDRSAFFERLEAIDRQRRALVAMLLADAFVEAPEQVGFSSLDDVLSEIIVRSRDHFWPEELRAKGQPIGAALPADALIAAATMAGHIGRDAIEAIETQLDAKILPRTVDDCARAIGSPIYPEVKRLDGVQPDLIGEFFALSALEGDQRDGPPFPWLCELAWRANEESMAAFAFRARQNFPGRERALRQIEIVVPGKVESWWLSANLLASNLEEGSYLDCVTAGHDLLIEAARLDDGAAVAYARLCRLAFAAEGDVLPFDVKASFFDALIALPVSLREKFEFREVFADALRYLCNSAEREGAWERRDELLGELRVLVSCYPDDVAICNTLACLLLEELGNTRSDGARASRVELLHELRALVAPCLEDANMRQIFSVALYVVILRESKFVTSAMHDQLLAELRSLAFRYPEDTGTRENLADALAGTLSRALKAGEQARGDELLGELRALASRYPHDAVTHRQLANALFYKLVFEEESGGLARRDDLLDELRRLMFCFQHDVTIRELLVYGLFSTFVDARRKGVLGRRDELFRELRELASRYSDEAVTRENLAMALLHMLNDSLSGVVPERRNEFLCELRALASHYPDEAAMRSWFIKALFNTLNDALSEDEPGRRDELLRELRALASRYPEDATAHECLTETLFYMFYSASSEGALGLCDELLGELRELAMRNLDDAATRKRLARALGTAHSYASSEGTPVLRDEFLVELRELALRYPDDAATREPLAKALFNAHYVALRKGELERRDELLLELRALATRYPGDDAVQKCFLKALFNTHLDVLSEVWLDPRDELLLELRDLASRYPDDAETREKLANVLFNAFNDAFSKGELGRRDRLLLELRALATRYPDDAAAREWFVKALFNTHVDAPSEGRLERRDELLLEFRALASRYPDDAATRGWIAKALCNTLIDAPSAGAQVRRDELLFELRELASRYPDDAAVRGELAKALVIAHIDASSEGELERRDELLVELRELARRYPDDAAVRELLAKAL